MSSTAGGDRRPIGHCIFGTGEGFEARGTGCFAVPGHDVLRVLDMREQRIKPSERPVWFAVPAHSGTSAVRVVGKVTFARDFKGRDGVFGAGVAYTDEALAAIGYSGAIYAAEELFARFQANCAEAGKGIDFTRASVILANYQYSGSKPLTFGEHDPVRLRLPADWYTYISLAELLRVVPTHMEYGLVLGRGFLLRDHTSREVEADITETFLTSWGSQIFGPNERLALEQHLDKTYQAYRAEQRKAVELSQSQSELKSELDRNAERLSVQADHVKLLEFEKSRALDAVLVEQAERANLLQAQERQKVELQEARAKAARLDKSVREAESARALADRELQRMRNQSAATPDLEAQLMQANTAFDEVKRLLSEARVQRDDYKRANEQLQQHQEELRYRLAQRDAKGDIVATLPILYSEGPHKNHKAPSAQQPDKANFGLKSLLFAMASTLVVGAAGGFQLGIDFSPSTPTQVQKQFKTLKAELAQAEESRNYAHGKFEAERRKLDEVRTASDKAVNDYNATVTAMTKEANALKRANTELQAEKLKLAETISALETKIVLQVAPAPPPPQPNPSPPAPAPNNVSTGGGKLGAESDEQAVCAAEDTDCLTKRVEKWSQWTPSIQFANKTLSNCKTPPAPKTDDYSFVTYGRSLHKCQILKQKTSINGLDCEEYTAVSFSERLNALSACDVVKERCSRAVSLLRTSEQILSPANVWPYLAVLDCLVSKAPEKGKS